MNSFLGRMLDNSEELGMDDSLKRNKVLLYSDVYISSYMDGEKVENMKLPAGSLRQFKIYLLLTSNY